MVDLQAFQAEVASWLAANCPPEMRAPATEADICWGGRRWVFASDAQRAWLERMVAKGWTVPTWPVEWGGAGLGMEEAAILQQEMRRIGARPALNSMGISMLGPALLKFGTQAQKAAHLPPIARGEVRWCQGYSEPGAGSDLASLQTRAEDRGDHFLLNGQKVWTSYADVADWMFCLVRTEPDAPKHRGISFLLLDMNSPGVSTRPIRLISGKSPFCETFLDNVRVPKENLVGRLNEGWGIAKYLLTHERQMIGAGGIVRGAFSRRSLGERAVDQVGVDESGRLGDAVLRARIAEAEIDSLAFDLTASRIAQEAQGGAEVGARSALLKYLGTEVKKRRHELLVHAAGTAAIYGAEIEAEDSMTRDWLRSKANSIEGGTSEIMLNIIAKNILGLEGA